MSENVIEVIKVTKKFGEGDAEVTAIHNLDLRVEKGEIVLIMGPSGSGKTTLLSLIGCLLKPTSGVIMIDGRDVLKLDENKLPAVRREHFGFVFQDFNLLSALTIRENVEVALNINGTKGKQVREKATKILTELGLGHRLDFRPEKLSGGEKQRVSIARALANSPAVILADEPTANLDSKIGREVMRTLHSLAKRDGRSVIIVSHDERIKEIADRILWLEDGEFKENRDMLEDPVCRMRLEKEEVKFKSEYRGKEYYFCSEGCRKEFETEPKRFFE